MHQINAALVADTGDVSRAEDVYVESSEAVVFAPLQISACGGVDDNIRLEFSHGSVDVISIGDVSTDGDPGLPAGALEMIQVKVANLTIAEN